MGREWRRKLPRWGARRSPCKPTCRSQRKSNALFDKSKEAFGHLDILVNNAGIYEFSPLEKVTTEHFHKHFNLNVLGLLLASQAAAKQFDGAGGSIINLSSIVSTLAVPESAVYSGTKGAVDAITRVTGSGTRPTPYPRQRHSTWDGRDRGIPFGWHCGK